MEQQIWTCVVCEKKFSPGQWTCADKISNHVVATKTYRSLDAPSDPGRPAAGSLPPVVRGRTMVCNIPPPKKVTENNEVKFIGEGSVEFINGMFATSDPEKQYWLDKRPAYNASEEAWKNTWHTKDERLAEKELELRAMSQRLENERNDLLAQTKQKVGAA